MKLYYYQTTDGTANFGDDLNEMIWSAYIPELLDQDDSKLLIGIGTLLNDFIPEKGDKIVFGSGVGYGKTLPRLNDQWQFYAVRGPLSALSLGLPPETAVVDPGVLIRRLYQANEPKLYKFSYMPHFHIAQGSGEVWESICRELGFGYIDPRWSVEKVMKALSQTEVLLAEAMHGAIVADAIRVPWVPIQSSPWILPYKWLDWSLSLKIHYQPHMVSSLGETPCLRTSVLKLLNRKKALTSLKRVSETAKPYLSDATLLESLTDELECRLEKLRKEHAPAGIIQPAVTV